MATYSSFKRITSDGIADGTIATADLANNSVTNGKLATDAVTQAKLGTGSVGATQMAAAIDLSTKTVTYRSVVNADISGSAGIAGSKLASGAATTNLGYTPLNNTNGTMTGNLAVPAGSAGTPGIALSGNTNTGIFFSGGDTVFTTGGTERMRINSAGRRTVGTAIDQGTMMFNAAGTSGWQYANSYGGPGWRELNGNFGWDVYQRGGSNFNTGTGRFTAPIAGFYHLQFQTYTHSDNSASSGPYIHFTFTRNGNTGAWAGRTPHGIWMHGVPASHDHGLYTALDLYLNAGEFTSVMIYWNNNESRFHGAHSCFTGYFIG